MTKPGAEENFSGVSRYFHWSVAVLILMLLIAGFVMTGLPVSEDKFRVYGLHKSLGLTVLALGVMRLLWRVSTKAPGALASHAAYERFLAKTIHIVFYISIIGMPLSGWLMSSAGEFSVNFFGLYEMPEILPKDEALFNLFQTVHELFAYALMICIALHVAGALKHLVIDRDRTMARMGASLPVAVAGLGLLAVAAGFAVAGMKGGEGAARAPVPLSAATGNVSDVPGALAGSKQWAIDPAGSAIEFSFSQYGQTVTGRFESWEGDIDFDPDSPETGSALIRIDPASIRTGSADRDGQARGQDWLAAEAYPAISFTSRSFRALGEGRFEASGTLELRGMTREVAFPFSLDIRKTPEGETALMTGELTLSRLDFGVGQGNWQSTEAIGDPVQIVLKVKATARPSENAD